MALPRIAIVGAGLIGRRHLVQRVGRYRGYGAVSALVRLAAHRRHRLAQEERA
jgi:hypothetical protein